MVCRVERACPGRDSRSPIFLAGSRGDSGGGQDADSVAAVDDDLDVRLLLARCRLEHVRDVRGLDSGELLIDPALGLAALDDTGELVRVDRGGVLRAGCADLF